MDAGRGAHVIFGAIQGCGAEPIEQKDFRFIGRSAVRTPSNGTPPDGEKGGIRAPTNAV